MTAGASPRPASSAVADVSSSRFLASDDAAPPKKKPSETTTTSSSTTRLAVERPARDLPPSADPPIALDPDVDEAEDSALRPADADAARRRAVEHDLAKNGDWILAAEREADAQAAELARLRLDPDAAPAAIEDLRIDHELKTRELNVAKLRRRKLRADLEATQAREAYALAQLELANARVAARTREVQTELERIQLYVAVVKSSPLALDDPERRHFFYCDAHVGGLGKWFADCLSERPNWHPYPAQKWFQAEDSGAQIYCPVGKVMVDYTDQPSFALTCGSCPGTDWLEDKARLARLIVPLGLTAPTWFVRDGAWVGEAAPARASDAYPHVWDHVWFMKETDKNFGTGIIVRGSPEACFAEAERDKRYVVQPSIARPRTDARGHKLGWRLYVACVSPAGSETLEWYMFCGGYLVAADGPFDAHDLAPLAQITKDRVMEFNEWDEMETFEPTIREKITRMLRAAQPRMRPPKKKACFELFGVDIIVTEPGEVFIVEVNRSPRVKPPDKPMMHALLNIAAPRYGLPQPGAVWDLLDVDPEAVNGWHPDPEAEAEEERKWGSRMWGPGGEDGQAPMPGAFGGDQDWGARAEERAAGGARG